jgi:hypothetical protein
MFDGEDTVAQLAHQAATAATAAVSNEKDSHIAAVTELRDDSLTKEDV